MGVDVKTILNFVIAGILVAVIAPMVAKAIAGDEEATFQDRRA
jgi:hypothetical protein